MSKRIDENIDFYGKPTDSVKLGKEVLVELDFLDKDKLSLEKIMKESSVIKNPDKEKYGNFDNLILVPFTVKDIVKADNLDKVAYVRGWIDSDANTIKTAFDKYAEFEICQFQLTSDNLKKIFPKATSEKREEVLEVFNKYCCAFEINTALRASHFFAQVKEEVGDKLVGTEESLFYSENGLKSIFGRYFNEFSDEIDKFAYKGKIDEFTYRKLSDLEKKKYIKFGKRYYTQLANEDEIAKRVYCCDDNGFILKQGGCQNGLLYKGKGFIQLTWKSNYEAVNKILKSKVPKENLDILNNPNSLLETKVGMLSAMGFWEWKKLNNRADKGATDSVVDSIINVVNEKTESRNNRKKYFQDIYKILKDTK